MRTERAADEETDGTRDALGTVVMVHADGVTPDELSRGRTLPPVTLLSLAAVVRDDARLWRGSTPRVRVLDRGLEQWGEAEAARRALDAGGRVVVLGSGRAGDAAAGDADVASLVGLGRRLESENGPLRIALVGDRREDAEALLREDAADLVLRGEADETLPRALRDAQAGRERWDGVQGMSWRCAQRGVRHEREAAPPRTHAAPAWDLVDLARYAAEVAAPSRRGWLRPRASRTATIVTSRACAPGCPTCHGSFGASARDRSVRDVVAEIRDLVQRRGARTLRIADHAFDGRPTRAVEIARAIARFRTAPGMGNLTVTLPSGLRGDGLTDDLVEALVEAGVRRFPVRVDTASPRLQRLLKQNIDVRRAGEGIERIARAGALGHLDLRLGLPTETTGEAAHTIRWARESAAHTATFRPGREASLGPAWTRETANEFDDFPALRRRALTSFYSCPRRAARLTKALPRLVPSLLRRAPRQISRATRALA